MRLIGETIGLAFQIKDDLLDYGPDSGKGRAVDIKEKKMTLPLIHTLQVVSRKEKRRIMNIVRNHNTNSRRVEEVIAMVKAAGGIEYTEQVMMRMRQEALDLLAHQPLTPSREAMGDLLTYVTERKK